MHEAAAAHAQAALSAAHEACGQAQQAQQVHEQPVAYPYPYPPTPTPTPYQESAALSRVQKVLAGEISKLGLPQ